MHAYWRTIYAGHERELVAAAATSWYTGHSRIAATLAELPRKQWMRVKAEDLLRQPRVILPRILDWLGLECSEEILGSMTRTERWCFAYTDPNGAVGGGDIKFLLRPALRSVPAPGPVVFSREWGLTREMTARMIRLAADLGY